MICQHITRPPWPLKWLILYDDEVPFDFLHKRSQFAILQYCNIAIFEHCTDQVQQMRVFNAQLEKEMRAEKKRNRKMLEKVHICI